jgi:MFS superfamily sulfate permease-like transporter
VALIGVLAATAMVTVFSLDEHGIAVIGQIPAGLPAPGLPQVSMHDLAALLLPSVGVAIVAFSDNVLTARSFASRHHQEIDAMPNSRARCVQRGRRSDEWLPVSLRQPHCAGDAAATTPVVLVDHVAGVLAVMLFARGVLASFPMAALGALVVYAALRSSTCRGSRWHASPQRILLAIATTVAVLGIGVLYGGPVAVGLSILELLGASRMRMTAFSVRPRDRRCTTSTTIRRPNRCRPVVYR